jgi:glycosyltransferase involved in cell wall biosynthesis
VRTDPRLSVALVTRNRPNSLRRTLQSIREQEIQPWEIVVSDDSDAPIASATTQSLVENYGCKYVRGPCRGLYANRNHAVFACTGTHIRTMDDDHEFPEGHFYHCLQAIDEDADAIWIIGEFLPAEDARVPPPCPPQLHPRGFSVTPPDPDDCWAMADGASIFPRSVFDRGERYAEGFVFGASYLEFGSRLQWRGYRLRFLKTTYVIHHYDRANRSYMDEEIDLGSRIFASLCHSFLYQPTLSNRVQTTLQVGREFLSRPKTASRAVPRGMREYRAHAQKVRCQGRGR